MRIHQLDHGIDRRVFVTACGAAGAGLWVPMLAAEQQRRGGGKPKQDEPEEEVSPAEDLMREHGVLKRVLLVYEEAIRRIDAKQDLPPEAVREGATIIRTFIEDYWRARTTNASRRPRDIHVVSTWRWSRSAIDTVRCTGPDRTRTGTMPSTSSRRFVPPSTTGWSAGQSARRPRSSSTCR